MTSDKTIFISYALEDVRTRDIVMGQSLETESDFEYVDMEVKEPWSAEWKERVKLRIRRCDGVIVLVSKNSLISSAQKWEIACARSESKRIRGIWIYNNDKTQIEGVSTGVWAWETLASFVDSL